MNSAASAAATFTLAPRLPLPPRTLEIAKVCGCCGQHHTWIDWIGLRNVGLQDDGDGGFLRLRDCLCLSTMAVPQVDETNARIALFLNGDS